MKFLPIVERELRVAARRAGTYWLRASVVLAVGIAGLGIVYANLAEPPQKTAVYFFHAIGGGALLYCLMIGARATADCLSEEKREGTLGLLFLTDLKGYDVVLGKLVANSVNAFFGLLAVIPLTSIALLMGGIKGEQVAWVAVVLVNTLFFSAAAGLCASACFRSARRAATAASVVVGGFTFGLPVAGLSLFWSGRVRVPEISYFLTSPIFTYVAPQDFVFWRRDMPAFFQSLGVIHATAWVMLLIACLVAPRTWQDRPGGSWRTWLREFWKRRVYGGIAERKRFRGELLEQNAFYWLAARDRLKPVWVWGTLGLAVGAWVWARLRIGPEWSSPPGIAVLALGLNAILKNWFAAEATRQISEERRQGSLELLLVTPLPLKDFFHGQWLALRRQFFWPVTLVLLSEVWLMGAGLRQIDAERERTAWLAWWVAGMVFLIVDLVALFWVGMWMGLASRNPKRAFSDTIGRVLALPWVIYLMFLAYMVFLTIRHQADADWRGYVAVAVFISLITAFGFAIWARMNLYNRFREAAAQRFERRTVWWKAWVGVSPDEDR